MSGQPTLEQRFMLKVQKAGPDECWLWTGGIEKAGYGRLSSGNPARGTKVRYKSHRLAWELANGPIPEGMLICHRCDVRRCCNPAHLFLGTLADNMTDMALKGRFGSARPPSGEKHPFAKLNREQAQAILVLCETTTISLRQIAKQFGVTDSCVQHIKSGYTWVDLPRTHVVTRRPTVMVAPASVRAAVLRERQVRLTEELARIADELSRLEPAEVRSAS